MSSRAASLRAPSRRPVRTVTPGDLDIQPLADILASPQARQRWDAALAGAGDVYYDLDYLRAAAIHETGGVHLTLFEHSDGLVAYPFVLRPVPDLQGVRIPSHGWTDVITPFEFGGPLALPAGESADGDALQAAFVAAFDVYLRDVHVVSEFVRFHPLLAAHVGWEPHYDVRHSRDNVVIDLTTDEEAMVATQSRRTRRYVRQALRRGVQIERAAEPVRLAAMFHDLYQGTMNRLGAHASYFFPRHYFDALLSLDAETVSLYVARDDADEVLSAGVFVHGRRFCHYHLGGTRPEFGHLHPTHLLMSTVATDMMHAGRSHFHLGGAAQNQEGLYAFKCGFSEGRAAYSVGCRVLEPDAFQALSEAWDRANPDRQPGGFFPRYRYA